MPAKTEIEIEKSIITMPSPEVISNEQAWIEVVTRSFAKGCTADELALFIQTAKRTGLDPTARQIYAIKRWDSKQNREVMSIQVSIDGLRAIAERTGKYAGQLGPYWCGSDGKWTDVWLEPPEKLPAAARVGVLRKDFKEPLYAVALWKDYYVTDSKGNLGPMWAKMPTVMLAKCLPYQAIIATDIGSLPIGKIVNEKLVVRVRSMNTATGLMEWKPVTNYWRNGGTNQWIRIQCPNNLHGRKSLRLTLDHPVLTESGYKLAQQLTTTDRIAVVSPTLNDSQDQVLLGSLLGDGSLAGRRTINTCPHFSEVHAARQRPYLEWKARALANLDPVLTDCSVKAHPVVRLTTKSAPALYAYRQAFYAPDKQVPQYYLKRLDNLGVAVWIMDDGSLKSTGHGSKNPYLRLYTCAFTDQQQLVHFFESKYNITPAVHRPHKNPYLQFSVSQTAVLLASLSSYIEYDSVENDKQWIARDIPVGATDGIVYVPVTSVECYNSKERQGRYDIEVEDNHNFLYNNVVISNCAESLALRRAFPADLSGLYTTDEMGSANRRDEAEIVDILPSSQASTNETETAPSWQTASRATAHEHDRVEFIRAVQELGIKTMPELNKLLGVADLPQEIPFGELIAQAKQALKDKK